MLETTRSRGKRLKMLVASNGSAAPEAQRLPADTEKPVSELPRLAPGTKVLVQGSLRAEVESHDPMAGKLVVAVRETELTAEVSLPPKALVRVLDQE